MLLHATVGIIGLLYTAWFCVNNQSNTREMHRKVVCKEQPAISPSGSHLQLGSYTVSLIPYCCFLYIAHQVILSLELSSHSIGIMPELIRQVIQSLVSRSTRSTCLTMISMTRWFTRSTNRFQGDVLFTLFLQSSRPSGCSESSAASSMVGICPTKNWFGGGLRY